MLFLAVLSTKFAKNIPYDIYMQNYTLEENHTREGKCWEQGKGEEKSFLFCGS